jgi:16S rRNA U516 pseudouridylate synthase RsuA-like enzyme
VAFGPLCLGRLGLGSYRLLTPAEVRALRRAAQGSLRSSTIPPVPR